MFDLADGHPYTIGPRKSRDDMMIDMEIAATFKAVCFLRGVEFEYQGAKPGHAGHCSWH